jgi:hypothetical protein
MSDENITREPVPGLPERPPEGEHILWQGRPSWWLLTWESLSVPWVIAYFVFLALWRFVAVSDLMPLGQALGASVPFLILGAVVLALLALVGWVQAVTTLYTVTNKRVAMRIGAALTVTLNLPYTQIANASLQLRKTGHGSIALETLGETRLSYLMTWPHVRPWYMRRTQPALRAIPDAAHVAELIATAAATQVAMPKVTRVAEDTRRDDGAAAPVPAE